MNDPTDAEATARRSEQPPAPRKASRSRWVAIVTGALSILIGLLYLLLVTVLDRSGPLLPPPPEAFADAGPAAPALQQGPPGAGLPDRGPSGG